MKVVMVAVHDSASSRDALRWAGERAAALGASLHVVTAIVMPMPVGTPSVSAVCYPDRDQLVEAGFALQRRVIDESLPDGSLRPTITHAVRLGEPFRVLRDESAAADVVVLGSPRRHGFRSLPTRCGKHLACPVVVVDDGHPR